MMLSKGLAHRHGGRDRASADAAGRTPADAAAAVVTP
jgi:hypothetical protein